MVTVRNLEKLSFTDSTAWLGQFGDKGKLYIVFRYGILQVLASEQGENPIHHGKLIFNQVISFTREKAMTTEKMKSHLESICRFED